MAIWPVGFENVGDGFTRLLNLSAWKTTRVILAARLIDEHGP